ncbi:MAG: cobalamin biosynthesis protein CbiD [Ruminococcus sp.]|nr:cobalamin biosynthesis protein CbiD [Ruminococcus sp.]
MLEEYVYKGTQKLRCGYTTGSCAASAAKAAAQMLLTGKKASNVTIMTPKGIRLYLEVNDAIITENEASCCIIKDSGDDPDITNGIRVYAKVSRSAENVIVGGKGIGRITKPGLDQPVGEAAINSVPRKMIIQAVSEAAEEQDYNGGFRIEISIPEGEALAHKTFNPRMGIEGGISVIGTTGIVEPMSNTAIVETIRVESKMRKAAGDRYLLVNLGNYSGSFVEDELGLPLDRSVQCSNFIGDAVDIAAELGFDGILIVGHIGKMVKVGAGIMNTHSFMADGRMETVITCGVLAGIDGDILKRVADCVTVDAALDIILEAGEEKYLQLLDILGKRIVFHLEHRAKGALLVGSVVFSYKHPFLLKNGSADDLINAISEESNG